MALLNAETFYETLKKKTPYGAVYAFCGDEVYLINEALDLLQSQILNPALKDFNLDVFYGSDLDISQLRDVVLTLPMMTDRRVVIVKDIHDLKEKQSEAVLKLVEEAVDSTILILTAAKLDKRKKLFRELQKHTTLVEFLSPSERHIPYWIKHIASKYGLSLDENVTHQLHLSVGSHLLTIDSEMQKLSLFVQDRKQIIEKDLEAVVSAARVVSIFELTEAIGKGDRVNALISLANVLEQGQSEVGIMSMIHRHIRILTSLQAGIKQGLQGQTLSQRAGIPNYFLTKYLSQCKLWKPRKLENVFHALVQTDRLLKSSPLSSHIWLENFIVKTC